MAVYARETSLSTNEADHKAFEEDYRLAQKPFHSTRPEASAGGEFSEEISLLKKSGPPLLILFGAEEKIVDPAYLDVVGKYGPATRL